MVASAVCSLLDGFSISGVDVMLYKEGTVEISNSGFNDTRVFSQDGIHQLKLVGQQLAVGKAFR